jgi:hypothetical protein
MWIVDAFYSLLKKTFNSVKYQSHLVPIFLQNLAPKKEADFLLPTVIKYDS